MKMLILAVASLVLFAGDLSPAARRQSPGSEFSFHLPHDIDSTHLSIYYFLTGPFGGLGGYVRTKPDVWDYTIETSPENKPAKTMRVIIYCRGYGMKLLDFPALNETIDRNATIELAPLSRILLSGRVILPKSAENTDFKVEATYCAYWGNEFFEIMDGFVNSFEVASTNVSEDGAFSLMVPDFAHDSALESFEDNGVLEFVLVLQHA